MAGPECEDCGEPLEDDGSCPDCGTVGDDDESDA